MKPFQVRTSSPDQRIIIYTDWHYPAHSVQATEELKAIIRAEKPSVLINLGDVFDNREIARFNVDTIHVEFIENGGNSMPKIWKEGIEEHDLILDCAPKARKITLFGNHDERVASHMNRFRHLLDGLNPLEHAWQNSRHINETYTNYPNNDFVLLQQPYLILSHGGKGTSGNHAKSTWVRDWPQGASRIYGHAHDPQFWDGENAVTKQIRDERFTLALGAMCDRGHKYFSYADNNSRYLWSPTICEIDIKNGWARFEEIRLTADPLPQPKPQLLGRSLNA